MKRFTAWLPNPRTALSGALIIATFAPWSVASLAWVALVPWLAALDECKTRREAAKQGLWLGIFMCFGTFNWVAYTLRQFGNLPWSLAYVGLALFSLIGQPQFLFWSVAQQHFKMKRSKRALLNHAGVILFALALLYTGIEYYTPKLFADSLGHAFHEARRLRQAADLGGVPLLTALAVWMNLGVWATLKSYLERKGPSLQPVVKEAKVALLPPLLAAIALTIYGGARLRAVEAWQAKPDTTVVGAVIQANIGDFEKVASEQGIRGAAHKIINSYLELTQEAVQSEPKPDFVVWPETAYPSTFRTPSVPDELARDQWLEKVVGELHTPLLFGGYDRSQGHDFNAFFFLNPSAQPDLQTYRKNKLLLFGEYIPLSETFPWIKSQFPQVGNFGRGSGPASLGVELSRHPELPTLQMAPAICYEILFSNYMREAIRMGARLIVNITNDSWFGPVGEPELHLSASKFRAIELRVPALRATNTGITTLILPTGDIVDPTPLGQVRIYKAQIPIFTQPLTTGVSLGGEWSGPVSLILGLGLLVMVLRRLKY